MPELMILSRRSMDTGFADQIWADLRGDDLVGPPGGAMDDDVDVEFTMMPSPMESYERSEPHMETSAVTIRFWKAWPDR